METKKLNEKKPINRWLSHVQTIQAENPKLQYKEVLVKAKETYTPSKVLVKAKKPKKDLDAKAEADNEVIIEKPKKEKKSRLNIVMSAIQSIVFPRARWTKERSLSWVIKHGFKPMKIAHYTLTQLRYRIRPPKEFKRFISKKIDKGIILVIGFK